MSISRVCQSIVVLCLMLVAVDMGAAQSDCCVEAAFITGQDQIAITDAHNVHIFDFNFQHQQTIPIVAADMPDGDIAYLGWGRSGDYFIIANSYYNPKTMPAPLYPVQVRRLADNQVMAEFLGLGLDFVDWSRNDRYVAIGSRTYTGYDIIKIITPKDGATVNDLFIPHGLTLFALRWHPFVPQLAIAIAEGNETAVWLCNPEDAFISCLKAATVDMSLLDIEYSPNGRQMAFNPYLTNDIAIYDFDLAQVVSTLSGHTDTILQFGWGAGGIAVTTSDQKLYLWNPDDTALPTAITTLNYHPATFQWNQDGMLLLTDGQRVELRDGVTGALIAECGACVSRLAD